jgi:hypothetical protein
MDNMTREKGIINSCLAFIFVITAALLLSATTVSGQSSFIVQPMALTFRIAAGQVTTASLSLQNITPDQSNKFVLRVVDLSQEDDGGWLLVDPDPNSPDYIKGFDTSKLLSCRKWITLDKYAASVKPASAENVAVRLKVPSGIRGFYCAGIVVGEEGSRPYQGDIIGAGVRVQYLVPVLVEITGRTAQHVIELTDVGLELKPAEEKNPSSTNIVITTTNKGATYSNITAFARLRGFFQDHWREITITEVGSSHILPGVQLKLKYDIKRSLPPGKYSISGAVYMAGRLLKKMDKEFDFVGDPTATKLLTDAPLDLEPADVIIPCSPGTSRPSTLKIYNASEDELNIKIQSAVPLSLRNTVVGSTENNTRIFGSELSCVDWLEVTPKEFTMPSRGQKTIRVAAKIPANATMYANYFALLGVFATYADGQNAGLTQMYVCLENKQKGITPKGSVLPVRLDLAYLEPSKYLAIAEFANQRDVYITPKCNISITTVDQKPFLPLTMGTSNQPELMLPLEKREFSGMMDLSALNFPKGVYRLTAVLDYGFGETATIAEPIEVTINNNQKLVRKIERQEYEQIVGIAWR